MQLCRDLLALRKTPVVPMQKWARLALGAPAILVQDFSPLWDVIEITESLHRSRFRDAVLSGSPKEIIIHVTCSDGSIQVVC